MDRLTSPKGATVRLRLHGTPSENRAVLAALTTVLDVQTVSRPYPDRPPSTLERIYVNVVPRSNSDQLK